MFYLSKSIQSHSLFNCLFNLFSVYPFYYFLLQNFFCCTIFHFKMVNLNCCKYFCGRLFVYLVVLYDCMWSLQCFYLHSCWTLFFSASTTVVTTNICGFSKSGRSYLQVTFRHTSNSDKKKMALGLT